MSWGVGPVLASRRKSLGHYKGRILAEKEHDKEKLQDDSYSITGRGCGWLCEELKRCANGFDSRDGYRTGDFGVARATDVSRRDAETFIEWMGYTCSSGAFLRLNSSTYLLRSTRRSELSCLTTINQKIICSIPKHFFR